MNYREYKKLELTKIENEVLEFWEQNKIFELSTKREDKPIFTFYEGPPSTNGAPGIHHVLSRTIKDVFSRYKLLKGFNVLRKSGWDTHGLPIELSAEKKLGIKKENIGTTISIEDYNKVCKAEAMKYIQQWNKLTARIGCWIDLNNPYITYENYYIESLWYLLKELYNKGYLYKGYTIQPYSPAAGSGLSSHELNQPGCYKKVKDLSIIAQFELVQNSESEFLFNYTKGKSIFILAWTTTPWTLPANTALSVGKNIKYSLISTTQPYSRKNINVIIATDLTNKIFNDDNDYNIIATFKGERLNNLTYKQLLPYAQPTDGDAFKIVMGDFVSTESGTGIVHTAPSFGADDFKVAQANKIGNLNLVDQQGKFTSVVTDFAGRYVKESYYSEEEQKDPNFKSTDLLIALKLKNEEKAFKIEKYEHNYPHCWRTDKPIIYYPLDSWFIKTSAAREKLIKLNKDINWKPASIGIGRFNNWLENMVDWNLSRSRFWGTPLPIWRSQDLSEEICIGSIEELVTELQQSLNSSLLSTEEISFNKDFIKNVKNNKFDLHKPYIDTLTIVKNNKKLYREKDLIDVWFDSGAMPYAQWHYPFENVDKFKKYFPADFIAEGVDQTRGWFFTLHVISSLLFDSIAYKNVISNGLVLDKNGNKMSKRLGNTIDPFEVVNKYGSDAVRWYCISNSAPWDDLKFNIDILAETQRLFFNTIHNTYSFFALYANIDNFTYKEPDIDINKRPLLDKWIISLLNSLIRNVQNAYEDYDPTSAARLIQNFVNNDLSNWYIRLSRRRFWKNEYNEDKISAFQTLYQVLFRLSQIMSPIAPLYSERLFNDLNSVTQKDNNISVHLTDFPKYDTQLIYKDLEEEVAIAQTISSLTLSLRKKSNIQVKQPLRKILIPVLNEDNKQKIEKVRDLILSETNVKTIEYISNLDGLFIKKLKPNFKVIGPKYGNLANEIATKLKSFSLEDIENLENDQSVKFILNGKNIAITKEDVEITLEGNSTWQMAEHNNLRVAIDTNISSELYNEGVARQLVNKIQNLRKEKGFEVTDRIAIQLQNSELLNTVIATNKDYIIGEILANSLSLLDASTIQSSDIIALEGTQIKIKITKNSS